MTESVSRPEKITKPIQLLGAWLAGLLSVDTCFLVSAANLPAGTWESSALVIAAIVNVPLFLLAVFLLQTKFRPEMQEDSYYATYLGHKTNQKVIVTKEDVRVAQLGQKVNLIESQIGSPAVELNNTSRFLSFLRIGVNRHLSDYDEISRKLIKFGVVDFKSFGAEEAPSQRAVAISGDLPMSVRRDVIKVAGELGFRRYGILNNDFENIDEQVLLGSYGDAEYEIAGLDASKD